MRRFISSLLAILVLVLSCMPCMDGEAGACVIDQSREAMVHKAGDAHPDAHQELCSPFCTCSCCAGFSLPRQVAPPLSVVLQYAKPPLPGYRGQGPFEVVLPIWQPPQLV